MKRLYSLLILCLPLSLFAGKGFVRHTDNEGRVYYHYSTPEAKWQFHEEGYDILPIVSDTGSAIHVRFSTDQEVALETSGTAYRENYFLPQLTGSFDAFTSLTYRFARTGFTLKISAENGSMVRTLSGNSSEPSVNFDLLIGGAWVFPANAMMPEGVSSVMTSKSGGLNYQDRITSTVEHSPIPVEILSAEDDAVLLRQHIPVTTQSGEFTVSWYTYVGGTDSDDLFAARFMPDGSVVCAGRTLSSDFPVTDPNDTLTGNYDMIIFRMDSAGQMMWATYYGGTNYEVVNSLVVVDSTIYLCASTNSADVPMLNAFQPGNAGSYDVVIARFLASGVLDRSTYFGGTGGEQGLAIGADSLGRLVIGGSSMSPSIPQCSLGYQTAVAGMIDAFIAVLDTTLTPVWSTYYGGSNVEDVHALSIAPSGNILLCGESRSTNFPVSSNAFQNGLISAPDVYYLIFSPSGARLYATLLGGSAFDDSYGIAGDEEGNVYLSGSTSSMDFPVQGNAFQTGFQGQTDIFVARFDSTGAASFITYFGGSVNDRSLCMSRKGAFLYIGGNSDSPDFPLTTTAPQDTLRGAHDAVVIKMDTSGNYITSSFFGGLYNDDLLAMDVNADTFIVAAGTTYSPDLLVVNAWQPVYVANGDAFVLCLKLSESPFSTFSQDAVPVVSANCYPNPVSDVLVIEDFSGIEMITLHDMAGRMILEQSVNGVTRTEISAEVLPEGAYLLRVFTADGKEKKAKVIVR